MFPLSSCVSSIKMLLYIYVAWKGDAKIFKKKMNSSNWLDTVKV